MVKLTESIVYIRTKSTVENVKKLNLWGCEIDDIEICERMKSVEVLSLSVNKVSNLEPLKECCNLVELYLRKNEITSLSELEHLRELKKLRILWIDENPCTSHADYRHKVVTMLPQLTKLDDKPVTLEDQRSPSICEGSEMDFMSGRSFHASTSTLVDPHQFRMNQSIYGRAAIIDTVMPSQMVNYGDTSDDERYSARSNHQMSQSVCGSLQSMSQSMHPALNNHSSINNHHRQSINNMMTSSVHPLMPSSVHPMMTTSMSGNLNNMMTSSYYEPEETQREEEEWGEFSLDEDTRPLSMDSIAPRMFQSMYEGPSSAREYRSRPPQASSAYGRSMSMPRRRMVRAESSSPARDHRHQKIMSAVSVLLDELDMDGLKQVIEEAQRRIKKQR